MTPAQAALEAALKEVNAVTEDLPDPPIATFIAMEVPDDDEPWHDCNCDLCWPEEAE